MGTTSMSTAALARARRELPHQRRTSVSDNQQFLILRILHIQGRAPLMAERCAGAASSAGRCKSPAPGLPAGVTRAFTMSAVPGLHKDEVAQMLQEFYHPSSPAGSTDELKQILTENMFPKDKPAEQAERRDPKSMKRSKKVTKAGAHATPGAANYLLTSSTREVILPKDAPELTDHKGFEKDGVLTYQPTLGQHTSRTDWRNAEMSPGSSWEWDRFVSWLNEQRSVQPRQEMTRDSK